MNKEDVKRQLGKIQIAYNKQFTQEEARMWFQEFQNISAEEFGKTVDQIIKTNKFTPKIADIRSRIAVNPNDYYINDSYAHLYKNLEWGEFVD